MLDILTTPADSRTDAQRQALHDHYLMADAKYKAAHDQIEKLNVALITPPSGPCRNRRRSSQPSANRSANPPVHAIDPARRHCCNRLNCYDWYGKCEGEKTELALVMLRCLMTRCSKKVLGVLLDYLLDYFSAWAWHEWALGLD